jgi:hypothetical protein
MENLELYKHIYKDSEMSVFSLEKLLKKLEEKDNKIKDEIEEIKKGYERYLKEVKSILEKNNISVKENNLMTKMAASMGIMKEVKSDNSDASIADMLIKGVSMGSTDMKKKIADYKGKADKKESKFAEEFLEFQQDVITGLKKFL